jgi:hypothetical protein
MTDLQIGLLIAISVLVLAGYVALCDWVRE